MRNLVKTGKYKIRIIFLGIIIELIGFTWDGWYHANGGEDSGIVPPAHWVILLGLVVVLYGTGRAWNQVDRMTPEWLTLSGVFLGGAVQAIGFVWDNTLHLMGNEPAPQALPHLFNYYGALTVWLFVLLFSVVVLIREARSRELLQSIKTAGR